MNSQPWALIANSFAEDVELHTPIFITRAIRTLHYIAKVGPQPWTLIANSFAEDVESHTPTFITLAISGS